MSRRLTQVQAMALGPLWLPRGETLLADTEVRLAPASEAAIAATPPPSLPAASLTQPELAPATPAVTAPSSLPPVVTAVDWPALQHQVAGCQACALCQTRKNTVFGRGNTRARWLLIGEAPGEQEDRQGQPFVGRAGQLLDNMLRAAGLDPAQDVYICNVLKCRPPANRNPQPEEIAACAGFLRAQIAHIRPTVIVALGRFAAQTLLDSQETIGRLRGRVHHYEGIPLIASFHPAYLLRSPSEKARAWQDLLLARQYSPPLS